jgi:hypothetical protein
MTKATIDPAREQRFAELWNRRGSLATAEVEELYRIVWSVLGSWKPSALSSLPGEHADYVVDFFTQAVLLGQGRAQARDTGVLYTAYRNYLLDCLRSEKKSAQRHIQPTISDDDEEQDPLTNLEPAGGASNGRHTSDTSLMTDFGLSPESLDAAANAFLDTVEPWAKIYLAIHQCADKEQSVPLSALAKKYGIASYHYQARYLGITRKKGELLRDYEKTLIGRWLVQISGETFSLENRDFYRLAFNFLCAAALNWAEENPV